MDTPPAYTELADKAGISKSYANEIINGRAPPQALAVHIFQSVGWKPPVIAAISDDDLCVMARVNPWTPRTTSRAAA